jgi:hypothetical protein
VIDADGLVAFVRARLDEVAAVAAATADTQATRIDPSWSVRDDGSHCTIVWAGSIHEVASRMADEPAAHIALQDPAHTLRDIASKRLILDEVEYWTEKIQTTPDYPGVADRFDVARGIGYLLALPFEHHPEYREEWRP